MTKKMNKIEEKYSFRTLNYLGSKLRLLDFIQDIVHRTTPSGGGVCDLFAGSGCVAYRLSEEYNVTACDIQHYSTVICDALLNKQNIIDKNINDIFDYINSTDNVKLYSVFNPLIEIEEQAIKTGNLDILSCIIDNGSVEVFRKEKNKSIISDILNQVSHNLEVNKLISKETVISRYYGGVFFSYKQAVLMDMIRNAINYVMQDKNKNLFLAALLSTASDTVDTVGKHFAQPLKTKDSKGNIKKTVYNKALKDKRIDVLALYKEWLYKYIHLQKSNNAHTIIRGDYLDCLKKLPPTITTIYADPPYTRDHYSRFYHVLETMALGDVPKISTISTNGITHISKGIYREERHQSPFCIKSKAPKAFKDLFSIAASMEKNLLLSYSPYDKNKKTHPRVVTIDQLIEWAHEYFENVTLYSAGHFRHNKLNSTEHLLDSSNEAEIMIVCTNKNTLQ